MSTTSGSDPIDILIADDSTPVRELLARLLSRYDDLRVIGQATSGEEAIALALERCPAVVVMDVQMPGIGGVEATRRLLDLLPRVRVVAFSAQNESERMRAAGASDFVVKGSSPLALIEAIRAASSSPLAACRR